MRTQSTVHSHVSGRNIKPLVLTAEDCADVRQLARIGLDLSTQFVQDAARDIGFAMDDTQGLVTAASISNPVQFLQAWLPGFVRVMTGARKIDTLIGVTTVGSWEDEEIIQGVLESLGTAAEYGDITSIPLSNWNLNFERRTVVRWEKGLSVGMLEDARSARVRVNTAAEKRAAASLALEIIRNRVGFYGYNSGGNRTYGFLNDPNLPAYSTVAATGSGSATTWSSKTFLNITADLRGMFAALQTGSKDLIDPAEVDTTLALSTAVTQYLTVTSDYGISVRDWLAKTYPKCRIVSAPELDGANGGANVAYLYADTVPDGGTDGGNTWAQLVPAKFMALGTEKRAKSYVEDFANATAGALLKRPFAVVRRSGL